MTNIDYAVLIAYLGVVIALGIYFARRERSTTDYFRAGGRVPWWAAGLSIYATYLSTLTFLGIPGVVYATNWAYFLGVVGPLAIAPIVTRYYLPFFRRLNVTSAYEYLEKRFSRSVRLIGSGLFILFHLGRSAIVLVMPALVLSQATGMSVTACIALLGVMCVIYTMLGGIEAVIWTDVLQVVVLAGGALAAMVIVLLRLDGGLSEFVQVASANHKFDLFNPGWSAAAATGWVIAIGYPIGQLGVYSADQTYVQRYLTTPDEKGASRAIWLSLLGGIPISLVFYTLGTAMWVFYHSHPQLLPQGTRYDDVLPLFIVQQLPVGLTGLIIAGLFAAGMSTIDSDLNSIATAILTDFRKQPAATIDDQRQLAAARWTTFVVGALIVGAALWLASLQAKSMLNMFLRIFGISAGLMGGLFAMGIFTRRINSVSALLGVAIGSALVALAWWSQQFHFFLFAPIGLIGSFAAGYLISITRPTVAIGNRTNLTIFDLQSAATPEPPISDTDQ